MSSLFPPTPSNRHPDRAPPPSLFLGPPSRNTSAISLSSPPPTTNPQEQQQQPRDPLLRTRPTNSRGDLDSKPSFLRSRNPTPSFTQANQANQPSSASLNYEAEGDRTDALWAEMQATLAEVELSAFSSTHVFGAAHSEALEELRGAQVLLARAWGRSEGDDGDVVDKDGSKGGAGGGEMGKGRGEDGQVDGDEEQVDILMARMRREANERFFKKVQEGVGDVVGRLEIVAEAMGKVERESREIWESGSESLDTGSMTS